MIDKPVARPRLRLPDNPDSRGMRPLLASSKATYKGIQAIAIREAGEDPNALVEWFERNSGPDVPIGSVLPRHAAIKRLLLDYGYSAKEIRMALPKPHGREGRERNALSVKQLGMYFDLVGDLSDPMRTLLRLLPLVGLRVSEMCNLTKSNIAVRGDYNGFEFFGKGNKARFVPFSGDVKVMLDRYLQDIQGEVLFTGRLGAPITRFAVNAACKRLREIEPKLGKLTPHVLRHSFATVAVEQGVSLAVLQKWLGHSNINTTMVYAKVTDEASGAAMQRMGRKNPGKA
jgi:integrase